MTDKNISNQTVILENSTNAAADASHAAAGGHNPLSQFEVKKIFDLNIAGFDISFTNSSLYMVIATFLAIFFMAFATRK